MSEEVAASIGDVLAENARLRARVAQLDQENAAWRIAFSRQSAGVEKQAEALLYVNGLMLGWLARASAVERDARRLVAAWRTQRQYRYALADALQGLLDEPYGCPLCDAGRVLNPAKGHWPECPYEIARVVLAELREA